MQEKNEKQLQVAD